MVCYQQQKKRQGESTESGTSSSGSGYSDSGTDSLGGEQVVSGSPKNSGLHNPGNIRKTITFWKGEVFPGASAVWEEYKEDLYGDRAIAAILLDDVKNGNDTIAKIISRYAPPSDNNPTAAYIKFVSDRTGIGKDEKLTTADFYTPNSDPLMRKVVKAMARFEQGNEPDQLQLQKGYTMFLQDKLSLA